MTAPDSIRDQFICKSNEWISKIKQPTEPLLDEHKQRLALLDTYHCYIEATECLFAALKYTESVSARDCICERIQHCLRLIESLREIFDGGGGGNTSKTVSSSSSSPSSSSSSPTATTATKLSDTTNPETQKLEAALSKVIVKESPNVKWTDIAGLDKAKGVLKEATLLPKRFPSLFVGELKAWKGILLYGPPGTGKSLLAKAAATETGSTFMSVSSSDLVSKYVGDSELNVKHLFELARLNKPCIIFIDEIDSLCSSRSDSDNDSSGRILNEFLVQMDGVGNNQQGVLVLGATNLPWKIDVAILRRFEQRIYIPLPDELTRLHLFKIKLQAISLHTVTDQDLQQIVLQTEGYSGSDIAMIMKDVLYQPIRQAQAATHFKPLPGNTNLYMPCLPTDEHAQCMCIYDLDDTQLQPTVITSEHIWIALQNVKPSVGTTHLLKFDEWTNQASDR